MKKKIGMTGLFLAGLAVAFAACSADTDNEGEKQTSITPYSLTAVVPNADVPQVLKVLAAHIEGRDDTLDGLPDDWLVAGAQQLPSGAHPSQAAMNLPGETKLLEVCNHTYAGQAMAFGGHHGVALPCKIALVKGNEGVEVYLLNPEAIFGAFFWDVPAEYAENMAGLAATVRGELEGVIASALEPMGADFPMEDVGPVWMAEDMGNMMDMSYSVEFAIEIPVEHEGDEVAEQLFKEEVVWAIMEALTYEGMEGKESVGSQIEGLSVNDWHAARPTPVSLPGGISLISMCSSTYASAALSTGLHHAPALPCRSAVWVKDGRVHVHLLDPGFMFPVFFGDVPQEQMESMGGMAQAVRQDLTLIIETALQQF